MKQNDYIIVGVAGVLGLGIAIFSAVTARPPTVPPDPQAVVTSTPLLPDGSVKYANGLPTGGATIGGASGFGGGKVASPDLAAVDLQREFPADLRLVAQVVRARLGRGAAVDLVHLPVKARVQTTSRSIFA